MPGGPADEPLVSIVTPSYNQGRFLRRTIESVLAQTYPHVEYRVCDGGSTDESVEILKSYGDRFPWTSGPDGGQTPAINAGLAKSRGQILAYLNSDDTLEPDAVAKVVEHFRRRPACDVVYGDAWYTDEHDRLTHPYETAPYSWDRLFAKCIICQPAAFWRRRVLEQYGPFDESLNYSMDYEYWMRVDRGGGVIEHLPEVLAYSRLHSDAKSVASKRKCYEETLRVCRRHGPVPLKHLEAFIHFLRWEEKPGWFWRLPVVGGYRMRWIRLQLVRRYGDWRGPFPLLRYVADRLRNRLRPAAPGRG